MTLTGVEHRGNGEEHEHQDDERPHPNRDPDSRRVGCERERQETRGSRGHEHGPRPEQRCDEHQRERRDHLGAVVRDLLDTARFHGAGGDGEDQPWPAGSTGPVEPGLRAVVPLEHSPILSLPYGPLVYGQLVVPAELRDLCLTFPGAAETFPFGPETSVFKVGGKMFALSALARSPLSISLKCEPTLAEQLREMHSAVLPGYHLNKRHWNTVILDGSLTDPMIRDLLEDSYDLVVSALPASRRRALGWRLDEG